MFDVSKLPAMRSQRPARALLMGQATGAVACMGAFGFRYDLPAIALLGMAGLLLSAAVAGLTRRRMSDAALLLECYLLLLASAVILSAVTCTLAATKAPYVDDVLIAIDRRLFGSSWLDIATFFSRRPLTTAILSFVYSSLSWQPFVILGLLVLRRRHSEARSITLTWLIASTLCVLAMPVAPALGGYLHYGTRPADFPYVLVTAAWDFEPLITAIRSGQLRALGAAPIVGIVTFPSFHAAGAIILGYYGRHATAGFAIFAINAAMLISTVPIGGHYIVDVLAGAAIALVAIAVTASVHASAASGRPAEPVGSPPKDILAVH